MASRHKPNVEFIFMFVSSSLSAQKMLPYELFRNHRHSQIFLKYSGDVILLSQIFFFNFTSGLKLNIESTFYLHREIFISEDERSLSLKEQIPLTIRRKWDTFQMFPLWNSKTATSQQYSLLKESHPVYKSENLFSWHFPTNICAHSFLTQNPLCPISRSQKAFCCIPSDFR